MKRQIRRCTFETNSSSVHSITMCSKDEYKAWEKGEVFYDKWDECFISKDEIVAEVIKDERYDGSLSNTEEMIEFYKKHNRGLTSEQEYYDESYYETFYEEYETKNRETVVAFGYYGEDR